MILSGKAIEGNVRSGNIGVEPLPERTQYQPASLDVRLGSEFARMEGTESTVFERETLRLEPGVRYLGHTEETFDVPNDLAGQLAGRSSVGRKGIIVHKTAGWIDPGFTGDITLELMNLGDEPVALHEGQRVAQMVFFKLDQPSSGYDGHYQNQSGVTQAYND